MSSRVDVSQRLNDVVTRSLFVAAAERRVGAPGVIPELNRAEGDLIRECCRVADAYRELEPGETPREWREPKDRKGAAA